MIKHLTLHLTDTCNLRCEYCHVAAIRNSSNHCDIIADEDLIKLFSPSVKSVSVAGGEPFIDKQKLYHLLDILPTTIQDVAITTNGTLLQESDFIEMKSRHIRLQFSIDGSEDKHENNRGRHTYTILKRNIDKAISYGLRVDLLTTVGRSNIDTVIPFVKQMDKEGIENITLLHFTPKGRGIEHSQEEVNDFEWFIFVTTIGKKLDNRFTRVWIQPRFLTENMVEQLNSVRKITFCNCFEPNYAYVDLTSGLVYPCGLAFRTPLCFGNICDQTVESINELGKNTAQFQVPTSCSSCQHVLACKGGAKCYSWLENQDYNTKDTHCHYGSLLPICPFPAIMVSGPSMHTKQPTIV